MKKNIKRLVAVLVVMAMIISLCSTAFAAPRSNNKRPSRGNHKSVTTDVATETTAPVVEETTETPTEDQATVETAEPAPEETVVEDATEETVEDTAVVEDTAAGAIVEEENVVDNTASADSGVLTADGDTCSVTVTYDEKAGIPEGATLEVKEISEKDSNWNERSHQFADTVYDKYGNVTISDVRFLDISILVNGEEYEPAVPVEVTVTYNDVLNTENTDEYTVDEDSGEYKSDPEDQASHFIAVHYTEDETQILESDNKTADESIVESTMMTPGFSEYDLGFVYEYDVAEKVGYDSTDALNGTLTAVKAAELGATADANNETTENEDVATRNGDTVPYISKTLGNNGDGTYTLGLDVTGSADSTASASPVNVLIVYDVSSSMTGYNVPMTYGAYGSQGYNNHFQLYKFVNRSYSAITDEETYTGDVYRQVDNGWWANPRYTYSLYDGQRFSSSITRADAAEKTLYDFTTALFGYQDQTDPTNIQAALITFSGSASTTQGWTSTATDITNRVSNTGTSHKLSYTRGTNWEGALAAAYTLINDSNKTDKDPTYVVFITDGAPTSNGSGTGTNVTSQYSNSNNNYVRAMNEARLIYNKTTATGGSFYGIYAYGDEEDWLASLMYYGYNGSETTSTNNGKTFDTEGYYNASSTEALNEAISDIFSKIVDTMGVGQASITDGTTSSVTTTTGQVTDMLEVDDTTFQYWLSWQVTTGTGGTYTFTMPDKYNKNNGEDITYTVSVSGDNVTLSWSEAGTAKTATYTGTVQNNVLTIEWTGATDFYNFIPPTATYTDSTGAVDWNLNGLGTLLDGVTYRVTFEVYPSQTTLDLIADLKNGYVKYDELDANIKKYLSEDYQLKTNTGATLTYTDTRNDDGEQKKDYTDPDPVGVSAAKQLAVSKKWNNTLDDRDTWISSTITLWVTRDGVERYPITMNAENDWSGNAYISYGTLTRDADGTVHMKTTGHDYSFAESIDVSYNWEIEVPTVRPMLINAVETMLVKVDEANAPAAIKGATADNAYAHVEGDGDYYKLTTNGKVGYYKVDTALASLTATNHRRSYLDVVKTVDGNAQEGDEFEFTMTVSTNVEGADPENYNSDAWVWFSIYDTNAGRTVVDTNAVSAAGLMYEDSNEQVHSTVPDDFNGYYCVPTGTEITANMQDGYSLRFLNLPVGTTYTVTESENMPSIYDFVDIEGTRSFDADLDEKTTDDWTTEDAGMVDEENQSISGTIEYVESAYKVEVTNKANSFFVYHSSDNTIEKISMDDERITEEGKFDLVSETKDGFLYGGYYKAYKKAGMTDAEIVAAEYTKDGDGKYWHTDDGTGVAPYDANTANIWKNVLYYTEEIESTGGGTGTAMTPVGGVVYYLKEVPNGYIRPYIHYTWDDYATDKPIQNLYVITATDDTNYADIGYIVDKAEGMTSATTTSLLISVKQNGKIVKTLTAKSIFNSAQMGKYGDNITALTRGYLNWSDFTSYKGKVFTFQPCWETYDGVLVKGLTVRTVNDGISKDTIGVDDN